jgi:hypothetical protein
MVTEAASTYGLDARYGYIRARIKSRDLMPSFETKIIFYSPLD